MFERYTEKARRVIFFARYEASQFGAPSIEPEHLLLGLMREDKTLTGRFFPRAQVNIEAIRKEIEGRTLLREKISTSVELPLAPETKRVLGYAHEESDRLQHRHIGTEHLLLGLLREDRSMAAELLYEGGLRLNSAREELKKDQALGNSSKPNEPLVAKVEEKVGSGEFFMQEWLKLGGMRLRTGIRTILGLEKLLDERLDLLRGARVGLICNQSSVDHHLRHAADLLSEHNDIKLTTLFGPQRGIR